MGANRKRAYAGTPKRPTPTRPATGHTFLIVVEGAATEPAYLDGVKLKLKRKAAAVVVRHGDHTDPVGIVNEAIKLLNAHAANPNKEPYDQVWVVFDRETQNHPRRKQVPAAQKLAEENNIRVALSVPSFEFWLLLHFRFTMAAFDSCAAVKKELKKFIKDYEKSDLPLEDLLSRIGTAVNNASKCHNHWNAAGGDHNPSTHVDKLLRELNDSARAEDRLF